MKISRTQFDFVLEDLQAGRNTKETAIAHLMSERMVQRIKEAGTWERWPYIVAKATHGYNTPEYKQYLKRRGLPLQPPAKTATNVGHKIVSHEYLESKKQELKKPGYFKRFFGGWFK